MTTEEKGIRTKWVRAKLRPHKPKGQDSIKLPLTTRQGAVEAGKEVIHRLDRAMRRNLPP